MKRAFKKIIPILMAIVVIFSIGWYLFDYDTEFTRDMLLSHARFFEDNGNHTIAAWLYRQAYLQSDDNEEVAIELAEQFKQMGNYTKAEYTLTNAIADGGSAELYIALCKTYVEQDKLLDAVTMLDNIPDAGIKAQLDALRPDIPTASPAPGYYSQYMTVTVQNTSDRLYITTDGEYPSLAGDSTVNTVTLSGGENIIYAISVSNNGLVSPCAVMGYTVGGVIEPVTFTDPSIEATVRKTLGLSADTTVFTNDLWEMKSLMITDEASSVDDLVYFPYLQTLYIDNSMITDISSLSGLTQLTTLSVKNCMLTTEDMMIIASLPCLQTLTLNSCNISSIESLANAEHLTHLDLSDNTIRNLSPLSYLSNLQSLNLSHNAVTSLNDLSALTGLQILDVSYNSVSSITPVTGCTNLTYLDISHNMINDLNGLSSLNSLTTLLAGYNLLADVEAIGGCISLLELDISNNELTNIDSLTSLKQLSSLDFSKNQVSSLPIWEKDCALVFINGAYNQIESLSGLKNCKQLNKILMDYNNISSVDVLVNCKNLIRVDVYGNPVQDISALKDLGITVNYTPPT